MFLIFQMHKGPQLGSVSQLILRSLKLSWIAFRTWALAFWRTLPVRRVIEGGSRTIFLEVIVIMQSSYLDQSYSSSNLIWFDIAKTLYRAFMSIVPGTLLLEVWGCTGCLDFGRAALIISALSHSIYHWQDLQLLPSSGLTNLTPQTAPVLCSSLQCCDQLSE